jgi:hypothetical protein
VTTHIRAQITRWVSDDFPGIFECRFADRFGREWTIIDKLPVLTLADLGADSQFPQPALIACEVVAKHTDHVGREIAEITIALPWGLEAADGPTSFEIFAEQLYIDLADDAFDNP